MNRNIEVSEINAGDLFCDVTGEALYIVEMQNIPVDLQGNADDIAAIEFNTYILRFAPSHNVVVAGRDTAAHQFEWSILAHLRRVFTRDDFQVLCRSCFDRVFNY